MLCGERTQLMLQYARAINHWFETLDALHRRIGGVPQTDYEVFRATALQARDECQTRKRRLQDHKVSLGC